MLRMKRIFELPQEEDGFRILIDKSWPEGLSKEEAKVDLWLNELTEYPDNWPENDPVNPDEFQGEYNEQSQEKKAIIKVIRDTEKEKGTVTFVYSTIKSMRRLSV